MSSSLTENQTDKPDEVADRSKQLLYTIHERPPWYLWLLLSFQHFLVSVTNYIPVPLILAGPLCLSDDVEGMGQVLSTYVFVGGVSSLLVTTMGIRLPIIQGPSGTFLAPIIMLMNAKKGSCPDFSNPGNTTLLFKPGSDEHKTIWKANLQELQGALMCASLLPIILGFSGLIGILMRYIGPLSTATVLTLVGLSLSTSASDKASSQWWISFLTIFLIILFSQFLKNINVPFFGGERLKIFQMFPVLLSISIAWLCCLIVTVAGLLPDQKGQWGYEARTDTKMDAIRAAPWFRVPYPGQWGTPRISAGGVMSMVAAILSCMVEYIGDYYACARFCAVAPPPRSAISRGIGVQGIVCLLGGAWGTGGGYTTLFSNVATIGLTKVASRVVILLSAVMLTVVGCLGKVGAFFSTVPEPIVGGIIFTIFGMIAAIGVSNLQTVDLNSTRNLFVFGFSVFFGHSLSDWLERNPLSLGNDTANQVLTAFCSASMMVGGTMAFVLDNTLPGTLKERGIVLESDKEFGINADLSAYDMPFIQPQLYTIKWLRYVPFCPGFIKDTNRPRPHPDIVSENLHQSTDNGDKNNCSTDGNERFSSHDIEI